MEKIFDTIIAGGGVSGLMAASILENSLLIEGKKEIGAKSPDRRRDIASGFKNGRFGAGGKMDFLPSKFNPAGRAE